MTPQEAAALLAVAAAFDNRKPDPDAATAWAAALHGIRFQDARDAIVQHYRTTTTWIMPAQVIAQVKKVRAKRLHDYGPIPTPEGLDPDNHRAYRLWLRQAQQAIADGEPPTPPPLPPPTPMPAALTQAIRQYGQEQRRELRADNPLPTSGQTYGREQEKP